MKITAITMYRSYDAEMFIQVVEGELTDEQKEAWRIAHKCDEHDPEPDDGCPNNMFFRVLDVLSNEGRFPYGVADLWNVDETPVRGRPVKSPPAI